MHDWILSLHTLTHPWWPAIMVTSLALATLSLLLLPWLLAQLPANHFIAAATVKKDLSLRTSLFWLLRNLLALILLLAGFLMLFLPGQGLLTLLLGIVVADIPGKQKLERALMRHPAVFRSANWIRKRYHRPPFIHPDQALEKT